MNRIFKMIFILIFVLQSSFLFCEEIRILKPQYSKFEAYDYQEYTVTVNNGVIERITNSNNKEWIWTKEKLTEAIEISLDENGGFARMYESTYNIFKNGIVYYANLRKDNIQWKYEYEKSENKIIVTYAMNYGSKEKNEYVAHNEKWEITGDINFSKDKKLQDHNYRMTLQTGLSSVLFPFIFFDEDAVLSKNYATYFSNSELKEKNTVYSANNLRELDGNPWASANGFGINDKIEISIPVRTKSYLTFYNGFQSKGKLYLYEQNSRAKKISIKNETTGLSKVINLADTPDKQTIDISDIVRNEGDVTKLTITILDVFAGSKYKDLCIQAILPVE